MLDLAQFEAWPFPDALRRAGKFVGQDGIETLTQTKQQGEQYPWQRLLMRTSVVDARVV